MADQDSVTQQLIQTCQKMDEGLNGTPTDPKDYEGLENAIDGVVVRSLSARGLHRVATQGNKYLKNEVTHTLDKRNIRRKIYSTSAAKSAGQMFGNHEKFTNQLEYATFMEIQYENAWAPVAVGETSSSFSLKDGKYKSTDESGMVVWFNNDTNACMNISKNGLRVSKNGKVHKIQMITSSQDYTDHTEVCIPDNHKILYVSSGKEHDAFITYNGLLLLSGRNTHGQINNIGRPDNNKYNHLEISIPLNQQVCGVATGDYHTIILTNTGQVHTFGDNNNGQCYPIRQQKQTVAGMQHIEFNSESKIVQVAAGATHSLALALTGTVYEWGNDGYQHENIQPYGHGKFNRKYVHFIAAGGKSSCAINQHGELFTWGGESTPITPTQVQFDWQDGEKERITYVSTNTRAIIAVTHNGNVYGLGDNKFLGIKPEDGFTEPATKLDIQCETGPDTLCTLTD